MVKRKFDKISKSLKCFRAKTNRCGGDSWQSFNLLFKNGITHTAGALQLSVGQDAGIQAIVHAIHDTFSEETTKPIFLINAENIFSSINRKVALHNMKSLYQLISTYICNCCVTPGRLFIFFRVRYYLKNEQSIVIRFKRGFMLLAFCQCLTISSILF